MSYNKTETSVDQRLVIARTEVIWPRIYKQSSLTSPQQRLGIRNLTQGTDIQNRYKNHIIHEMKCQNKRKSTNWEHFFSYLGFLLETFTNHGTAGEGGGHFFNSSLPLPPASQTLRH